MKGLWRLMYSEYRFVASDEDLERRVRAAVVKPGVGTLKLMAQMLVFCGVPVYVFTLLFLMRMQQNPSLSPALLPLGVMLISLVSGTVVLYLTRKSRNRVFRRALIRCGVPVCVGCGYDLAESDASEACPECGAQFSKSDHPADKASTAEASEP